MQEPTIQIRRPIRGANPLVAQLPPFLQLIQARARQRRPLVALPLPARRTCLTKRALAALRGAELAAWQATGGDVLHRAEAN